MALGLGLASKNRLELKIYGFGAEEAVGLF